MYKKNDLLRDLKQIGILSDDYESGSLIELKVQPEYRIYVAESNISSCFWNVTSNIINKLVKNKKDFALVFLDSLNEQVYVYDQNNSLELLSRVSKEKKYGNYRIKDTDLSNPIDYNNFYEFLTTL